MALNPNFSNTDFTALSQFVAESVENSFAPFSFIGADISSDVPTGKSVRTYKVGSTVSESVFNGEYVTQDASLTGVDVALTHLYKSFILRDTDIIDGGGLSFAAKNIINSHVKQLAGDIQTLFFTPMTGSANAALSSSVPNASWGYNAVFSASIQAGNGNWEIDGSNTMILHSSAYRRVLGDPAVSNNYALAALTVDKDTTIPIPLQGFNIVESNSFPGTPNSSSQVCGVAIREGGVAFVLRPVQVDPVENNSTVEMVDTNTVPEKGFTYTLKSFRRPEKGGRQYVIEVQAGVKVVDPKYVLRLINT